MKLSEHFMAGFRNGKRPTLRADKPTRPDAPCQNCIWLEQELDKAARIIAALEAEGEPQ